MDNWKEVKLGDCLETTSSKRIFAKEYVDDGIPFYRSKEIIEKEFGKEITNPLYISSARFNEIKNKYGAPFSGDILISAVGERSGIPYVVSNDGDFYFKDGNLIWLKNFNENLHNIFLYYFLKSEKGQYVLFNSMIGSAQRALTIQGIKNLMLSIPPLKEQKAIAEVLSSLDDKIDLLRRQNKTLENLAQTLFRQYFIEEANDEWEEKPLKDFGDIICGKTPSKKKNEYYSGEVPFIKIPDMHNNTFIFNTTDTLTKEGKNSQSNKTLPPKSICVSCIATVGLVSMNIIESQTNQQINSIIPKEEHYRYYLYLIMKSSYELLQAMASGGTATLNLNTGNFKQMNILKPNDRALYNFHELVEPLFNKIFENQQQIKTLENLRDTLLPKLMSGEVKVKI